MSRELLDHYLSDTSRVGDPVPESATGAAGGGPCGDGARIALRVQDGRLAGVRIAADGCGATHASLAALAEEVEGLAVLDAALIGAGDVAALLGGLTPGKLHAAELAAEALHRALGQLARSGEQLADPPASGERVLVALSGGVDSAVAALRERERGAEVCAVTLELWADPRNDGTASCCSPEAVSRARSLSHGLGVPHLTLDLRDDFRREVVRSFVEGYADGRTPNPCVRCNGSLRLDAMLALADRLGASSLATGHYARLVDDGEGALLGAAADPRKDQTHMLCAVSPETLERLRFPLAGMVKPDVREIAEQADLPVARAKESQDLCFLAGEGKRDFLERHGGLADREGELVDTSGAVVGHHSGHHHFTVGQRRGLGVAASEPLYVLEKDAETNRVRVGPREALGRERIEVRPATLLREGARVDGVRVRAHGPIHACAAPPLEPGSHECIELNLDEPARGVAPGQTACLLGGDLVVGHGTIV